MGRLIGKAGDARRTDFSCFTLNSFNTGYCRNAITASACLVSHVVTLLYSEAHFLIFAQCKEMSVKNGCFLCCHLNGRPGGTATGMCYHMCSIAEVAWLLTHIFEDLENEYEFQLKRHEIQPILDPSKQFLSFAENPQLGQQGKWNVCRPIPKLGPKDSQFYKSYNSGLPVVISWWLIALTATEKEAELLCWNLKGNLVHPACLWEWP